MLVQLTSSASPSPSPSPQPNILTTGSAYILPAVFTAFVLIFVGVSAVSYRRARQHAALFAAALEVYRARHPAARQEVVQVETPRMWEVWIARDEQEKGLMRDTKVRPSSRLSRECRADEAHTDSL